MFKKLGPIRIKAVQAHTLTIDANGVQNTVSIDRVYLATPPSTTADLRPSFQPQSDAPHASYNPYTIATGSSTSARPDTVPPQTNPWNTTPQQAHANSPLIASYTTQDHDPIANI